MNRAISISSNCRPFASLLQNPGLPFVISKRFAKNPTLRTHQSPKAPGVKRMDGDYVWEGDIIVKQFNLHFHPGINVNIDCANTLRATKDGKVFVTCEKIFPNKSPTATRYYQDITHTIYKRYFHVVPFTQSLKFNLVDVV